MTNSTKITMSRCRRCGEHLDGATGVTADSGPSEGDVSICWRCGTVAFFDAALRLREPTVDEVRSVLDDPVCNRTLNTLWSLHLARVLDDGSIVEFRCGCRTTSGGKLFTLEACAENCAAAQTVIRMCEGRGKPITVIR